MSEIWCGNCDCGEGSVSDYGWFQCPECCDWICQEDNPDLDGYPYCMIHDGGVCADCCVGYEDGCSICAYDYCDDCEEQWDDCECDDDD